MHQRLLTALLALLVCLTTGVALAAAAADDSADPADPFGYHESDYSAWGIVDAPYPYDPAAAPPAGSGRPNAQGCFPVGNGYVFATLGLDGDFNTLTNLTGPGYQTRDANGAPLYWQAGEWNGPRIRLVYADEQSGPPDAPRFRPVLWDRQSIQMLRGAAMVRTVQSNADVTLYCMTYALPGKAILFREFQLVGDVQGRHYSLVVDRSGMAFDPTKTYCQQGDRLMMICGSGGAGSREAEMLMTGGQWEWNGQPARSFQISLWLYTSAQGLESYNKEGRMIQTVSDRAIADLNDVLNREDSLKETSEWWREWSSHNLKFDTGDVRLDDLMTQLPVIIETQRDAQSGGVAPMVSYHGYWVRDSLGPLYMYLLNGRFEEVMRMLRYHRKACWKLGSCSMLVPLDVDVSDVHEPVGRAAVPGRQEDTGRDARAPATWDAVPVEHAEVPSLIVLQHYWLWQALRSAGRTQKADAFIAEAWPFLTHNLFAMPFDPQYGVRFHGDETYTNGALYSTFDSGLPGELGWPNGYIPTDFFSFDNTLLHWNAAWAVDEMARAVFKDWPTSTRAIAVKGQMMQALDAYWAGDHYAAAISSTTQQMWPVTFANISLSPWSMGIVRNWLFLPGQYASAKAELAAGDEQQQSEAYPAWRTTPWSGFTTGHMLASVLNAARREGESPETIVALAGRLVAQATPEGAWCEVYDPTSNPVNVYGRVNRIRPWESGINYTMLTAYLADRAAVTSSTYPDLRALLSKLALDDQPLHSLFGVPPSPGELSALTFPKPPDGTQALVLTRDNHYQDVIEQDRRLDALGPEQVCAWDIGLPLMPDDLRAALLSGSGESNSPRREEASRLPVDASGAGGSARDSSAADTAVRPTEDGGTAAAATRLRIPYLYLDRDVKLSDRRTFKTQAFWDAVQPVLDEYKQLGGKVIDEDSLEIALADDEVVALKVLVVLYPRTFTWEMDADTIAKFHQEIAKWVGWYDQVGGNKLRLDLDFLQIDRRLPPLSCGPQGDNVYWMGFGDVEADLAARGIPRDHYDSVCCFWAWDREAPSLPGGQSAAQAYGGAAQGPGTDIALLGAAGRTSYYGAAVLKSHFITTGRVALHEYMHNLDAMFEMAGLGDRFYSSDDMEAHMPQMLAERPGLFEPLGYDDAAMLDLAQKSERGEAGFPWRTQLLYYQWSIERTPREDFARLLARYGTREKLRPRARLYDAYVLPQGERAYQIEFPEPGGRPSLAAAMHASESGPVAEDTPRDGGAPGFAPITIEDVDPDDGYVHWRASALGGFLADGDLKVPLRRYREAELVAPDFVELVLGQDEPRITCSLRDTVSGAAITDAQIGADFGGQLLALFASADGSYVTALPDGLENESQVLLKARAADYVISANPITLKLRPAWTSTVQFRSNAKGGPPISSPFDPGIYVSIDGPSGEYSAHLSYQPDYNTVMQKLADDGLLPKAATLDTTLTLAAGGETYIETDRYDWEALQYEPGTLRVDYTATDGSQSSFTEKLEPRMPRSTLLGGIDTTKLPDYIPRAILMSPIIDGDLSDWPTAPRVDGELGLIPAWPSLNLNPETGHAFNGEFSGDADCSARLWFAYDAENLYVAGRVNDDFIKHGDMWGSDRLNLVFDARLDATRATYPHGAVGHPGWAADDFWVLLCPFATGADGAPITERLGGEIPSGGANGYFGAVSGARCAVAEEPGGYRFEWALPLKQLPYLKAESGTFTGFTFFVTDHDADGMAELMYLTDWGTPGGIEWRFWDCGLLYFAP